MNVVLTSKQRCDWRAVPIGNVSVHFSHTDFQLPSLFSPVRVDDECSKCTNLEIEGL